MIYQLLLLHPEKINVTAPYAINNTTGNLEGDLEHTI